ncbi:MAG: c-type cytochrome biogenesis protein CcsB [Deltaproteobacteria bacterium HGW-Deltaproteobacteria-19]|jgi:cytochrome c-type biogenesis protein CcsB|nr:MAG: c-type cytochrome biogenesis protein CcsB [Deltaproteobacteria bacterium HGW-Deltaproteobacteria-19]
MISAKILSWVTFVYFASFTGYLIGLIRGRDRWARLASWTAAAGLLAHTAALLLRWRASYALGMGHAPLSNLYESLVFFAWAVVFLYLLVEWRTRNRTPGVFVVPVAFLLMAYASISPGVSDRIQPLIPALQSNWLTSHVITCFMGYAAFTVAFGLAILHLIKNRQRKPGREPSRFLTLIPDEHDLEELLYQSVLLGFVFLTLGIITGSVWAHYAWGTYWSWDPKETWSLVTWVIYAGLLHARYVRGWRGRRLAVLALVGFAAMLFTYLGVNYLPSLHAYM